VSNVVQRAGEVFTEEALAANDGKVVPLRESPGGPVIGEATLKYDPEEKALMADFHVNDPKIKSMFSPGGSAYYIRIGE
jgi:hypothetical protein